jgi:hypothetical protein
MLVGLIKRDASVNTPPHADSQVQYSTFFRLYGQTTLAQHEERKSTFITNFSDPAYGFPTYFAVGVAVDDHATSGGHPCFRLDGSGYGAAVPVLRVQRDHPVEECHRQLHRHGPSEAAHGDVGPDRIRPGDRELVRRSPGELPGRLSGEDLLQRAPYELEHVERHQHAADVPGRLQLQSAAGPFRRFPRHQHE